jgi:acetyl-CoA acyltransferase
MTSVYIAGVAMTHFGNLGRSIKDLTDEAVSKALVDAGLDTNRIGAAFYANATQGHLEGQSMIRGQIALRSLRLNGIPIVNVENACASSASALNMAYSYVRAGLADVVLAVGAEKMCGFEKERTTQVFDGAWDIAAAESSLAMLMSLGREMLPPSGVQPAPRRSVFMDIYASLARFHMNTYGSTQRQLAHISSKDHQHSTFNPHSQYRNAISVDEVLAARNISWPLTLPMCAPISDGAAAAIIVSKDVLRETNASRSVEILASTLTSGTERKPEDLEHHLCRRAAMKAYEMAGVGPEDVSVAEVHDATAFAELLQCELMGFCALGEGGLLAEAGATSYGGRIPINLSGGLQSKGHPIGATGLAQIFELVKQLRGEAKHLQVENAQIALAENGGGFAGIEEAVASVTILGRRRAA